MDGAAPYQQSRRNARRGTAALDAHVDAFAVVGLGDPLGQTLRIATRHDQHRAGAQRARHLQTARIQVCSTAAAAAVTVVTLVCPIAAAATHPSR